jgi:hypothetical protein
MSGRTATPNYSFTLPTIGGDQNTWGNELNGNWSSLDTILHNLTVAAGSSGSLPLTGGIITGPLQVNSTFDVGGTSTLAATNINGALNCTGTATLAACDVQGTLYLAGSGVGDFLIQRTAPQRIWQWAGGVTDVYQEAQGTRYWNHSAFHGASGNVLMSLESDAALTLWGNGLKPGGGPWAAASDERTKRHIEPYRSGLDEVCHLSPISFEYNGEGDTVDDGKRYYGLSAQATQPIMPELVFTMDTGRNPKHLAGQLGTNLGPLTLALVNACKELATRVAALEARCAA